MKIAANQIDKERRIGDIACSAGAGSRGTIVQRDTIEIAGIIVRIVVIDDAVVNRAAIRHSGAKGAGIAGDRAIVESGVDCSPTVTGSRISYNEAIVFDAT